MLFSLFGGDGISSKSRINIELAGIGRPRNGAPAPAGSLTRQDRVKKGLLRLRIFEQNILGDVGV